MKKLLALLLAGMMLFSLAACGSEKTDNVEEDPIVVGEDVGEETVETINMVYGDDAIEITLHKPGNAEFTLGSDTPEDAGDLVGICADDYSWDAEIMGYKYYEGIGSNVPFVDYYFAGAVNEEEYASYEESVTELGIDFEAKPVKAIRYTYKEVDDEEEYSECFVGFEYKGTEDRGLFGLKIVSSEGDLSDDELVALFTELLLA